ncbi:MAG: RNA polymerase sigma factor [Nocardioides sp.]
MQDVTAHTDAELVTALASGELAALRELYDRHAPWLTARLSRRCSDPDAVDDAVQDCFTAVWREAATWRGEGDVAAWLWGIAVRRLVSRLRTRPTLAARLQALSLAGSREPEPSAEERVLLGVEYGGLATALDRLSPELRSVVQATILDGLTTREAAQLLGVPVNTVKSRLRRAKVQLRANVAGGIP